MPRGVYDRNASKPRSFEDSADAPGKVTRFKRSYTKKADKKDNFILKIESGIPYPDPKEEIVPLKDQITAAFKKMKVGETFWIPVSNTPAIRTKTHKSLEHKGYYFTKKLPGKPIFKSRVVVEKGQQRLRAWRIS